MYKVVTVKDRVRVEPSKFKQDLMQSVNESITAEYENKLLENNWFIICLVETLEIGEGHIISGDGAIYYDAKFKLLIYEPLLKEVVEGKVSEINEYLVFVRSGPIEGVVHISQVMDDYISFSKTKSLVGKESKRTLGVGDTVRARIVAISMKNLKEAKIGLTMRQPGLGKPEWLEADKKKSEKPEKPEKAEKEKGEKKK
ncbi:DNA-directed RNA polymerase subunit E' [Candidatus Tiddalikarchaeum anstoanum]|nr:DNA-directed RNA polymerase subunit E' [Candidatus Tiddalikarchaeum anstoanum]